MKGFIGFFVSDLDHEKIEERRKAIKKALKGTK